MQKCASPYAIVPSSPQAFNTLSSNSPLSVQRGSPSFFDSLKFLMHHPLSRSRSPRRSDKSNTQMRDGNTHHYTNARQTRFLESKPQVRPRLRPERCRVEGSNIDDYLTLEQLEMIWQQQDAHQNLGNDGIGPSASGRGRQPSMFPSEIHPAVRPWHRYAHLQASRSGGSHHHLPISADQESRLGYQAAR